MKKPRVEDFDPNSKISELAGPSLGRVRYGGARGQLTVRANSGFYAHTVVASCREMDVRFSITIRQRASLRDLIGWNACYPKIRSPARRYSPRSNRTIFHH